jgi:aryl-alcohol dehydrogenase-like predicted oxidoreductase
VLPTCTELGIGFILWSPLGQGFLTGTIDATTTFGSTDVRGRFPCFSEDARRANQPIVDLIAEVAAAQDAASAQIALAWLLARGPWIIPIPGTRKLHRLEENLGAATIQLTPDDVRKLDDATATFDIRGARGTGVERYA